MKINLLETKEILDVEKEIGYELKVNERRPDSGLHRFYVLFENGLVMNDGMLIGSFGQGDSIDEALQDYASKISFKQIAFNSYNNNRKEIIFPKLVHTKLINT